MKEILAILSMLAALCQFACKADDITDLPESDIIKTEIHEEELRGHATQLLKKTGDALERSTVKISTLERQTKDLSNDVAIAQGRIDASAKELQAAEDTAQKETVRADKEAKLAAHRGMLLGWISASAGLFLGFSLMRFLPPPYNLALLLCGPLGFLVGRFLL